MYRGIAAANRKRRYRLGRAILSLYSILRETIDTDRDRHLRPHYEAMKRAYMKRKQKRGKAEEPDAPGE